MCSRSSTLSSESARGLATPARRFFFRLAAFVFPLVLIASLGLGIALFTGELLPVKLVARLQQGEKPFVFLPKLSDHTYRFKLEVARRRKPEVLVLGSSRVNQWRDAMFNPAPFYNAANAIFVMRDFRRMIEELGDSTPRVVILSVDYFTFLPGFEFVYRYQSREDVKGWGSSEQINIVVGTLAETIRNPGVLFSTKPGIPVLGLSAMQTGAGFRRDGSFSYGTCGPVRAESTVAAIQNGSQWPILPAAQLNDVALREFERFTDLARQKGITLVGVTMPFVPAVAAAMEQSPLYGAWRQFESQATKEWIRRQGVIYFDFSKLESFGGMPNEFVDPFHPNERAYIRMLATMLADPDFRALLPAIDIGGLKERLKHEGTTDACASQF